MVEEKAREILRAKNALRMTRFLVYGSGVTRLSGLLQDETVSTFLLRNDNAAVVQF